MTNIELGAFAYSIIALLSFMFICNAFATGKNGNICKTISPLYAVFLGIIWPISLLAIFIAFTRNK